LIADRFFPVEAGDANEAPPDGSQRELTGEVDGILWANHESGYHIARLASGKVVRGSVPESQGLHLKVSYRFLGRWERHYKHGYQFVFTTFVRDTPATKAGVVKYLQQEAPNVGKITAERLWDAFGPEAVAVLRTNPETVTERRIMAAAAAEEASQALQASAALERTRIDLFGLFAGRGFHEKAIDRAIGIWGARAPAIIRRNAYIAMLKKLPGAGWKRCDKLWLDLGGKRDRLKRQALAAWQHLRTETSGDTWTAAKEVAQVIEQCVGMGLARPVRAMLLAKRVGWIATRRDETGQVWIAEAKAAANEWTLSECVKDLLRT
jgi:exodeoxyribonuclease V alpha subunit